MIIVWLFLILLLMFIAQHVYYRLGPSRNIVYSRTFNRSRLSVGDKMMMVETITNRNRLPIPYVLIEAMLPASFRFVRIESDVHRSEGDIYQHHRSLVPLPPGSEITRIYDIVCRQRGRFRMDSVSVTLGDVLGFSAMHRTQKLDAEILVYPHVSRIAELPIPARGWLETIFSRDTSIMENHYNYSGVRPYQPGDGLKAISWKATARSSRLMVHKRETIIDHHCWVFLNVSDRGEGTVTPIRHDRLEVGVQYAASVAVAALKQGCTVGFASNGIIQGAAMAGIWVPAASGRQQSETILEQLSLMQLDAYGRFDRFLQERTGGMTGQNIFVITGIYNEAIAAQLSVLRKNGNHVTFMRLS